MSDINYEIDDIKAIGYFSEPAFSSMLFIGNWKKGICQNYDGSFCQVWSWGKHKHSGLSKNYVMGEPFERSGKLVINPDPFFCALCPKWIASKETLSKGSRI
jgi:hypothetical protein